MNQLDPITNIQLEDNQKKVEIKKDEKINNCANFIINKEDHSLGNMLKHQLLQNPKVLFSGQKVLHPLDSTLDLKVITIGGENASKSVQMPSHAVLEGLGGLINTTNSISKEFKNELENYRNRTK